MVSGSPEHLTHYKYEVLFNSLLLGELKITKLVRGT